MKTNSRIKEFLETENVSLKHLIGRHNQKTHGNRGGKTNAGGDKSSSPSVAPRGNRGSASDEKVLLNRINHELSKNSSKYTPEQIDKLKKRAQEATAFLDIISKKPNSGASKTEETVSPKKPETKADTKTNEVVNRLLSGYKDRPNQTVEIHIKVYTDGKYNINKSYRVQTTAGQAEKWIRESINGMEGKSSKTYNSYTIQDRTNAGSGSWRLVGEEKTAVARQSDFAE